MISLDEELRRKVFEQLVWDSRLDTSDIKIEVIGGKVILTGTVHTPIERMLAERDITLIPGVKAVENLLEVIYPGEFPGITDEEIREAVLFMLTHSAIINAQNIKVRVINGVVFLEGEVRSYWEKIKAGDMAEDVAGVVGVNNQIIVVLPEVVPDIVIKEDIQGALRRTNAIDPDAIRIDVRNGVVTLTGTVPTWALYLDIENTARYTHGVADVKNRLVVE
jgi:osmotically-inducible protein OsmY